MAKYIKVNVVTGVIIKREGKYLLVQEKKPIARGLWNFPAGRVEEGETVEGNAIKEVKEETNFDVRLVKKIGIFHRLEDKAVKHLYVGEIISGELKIPDEEILDAGWFKFAEIEAMQDKLRGGIVLEVIKMVEEGKV